MSRSSDSPPVVAKSVHERKEPARERRFDILAAATELFSQFGYDAVSIRDVANKAGVNSALIGYYFGTKAELYSAIFDLRYAEITSARVRGLDELAIEANSLESVRAIVRIWTSPLLQLAKNPNGSHFVTILAREVLTGGADERGVIQTYLDPSARRCIASLANALPQLSKADLVRGYLWMVACVMSSITNSSRMRRLLGENAATPALALATGDAALLEAYVSAGLLAIADDADTALQARRSVTKGRQQRK